MSEEISKLYLKLPGDTISGSMSAKNMIMLHEHRDVIIKLDFPEQSSFRLCSYERAFYDPKAKKQRREYPFASGEEIHVWLSKFHQTRLELEVKKHGEWSHYGYIDPLELDGADYSHNLARPAPIIIKSGKPDSLIGETVKLSKAEGSIPQDYRVELAQSHQSPVPQAQLVPSHQGAITKSSLLRTWDIHKFPSIMSREEGKRSCHNMAPEPEYAGIVEIQQHAELYKWLPNKEAVIQYVAETKETKRLVINALVATLGEIADKAKLERDLVGAEFDIKNINGSYKKFIIFKNYPGLRQFLNATKYTVANTKVVTITAKHLTVQEMKALSKAKVGENFTPGIARKVLITGLLLDTAQWLAAGEHELERLFAKWSITLLGGIAVAGMTLPIAAALGCICAGLSATCLVILVGTSVVALGVCIGWLSDKFNFETILYNLYKQIRSRWVSDLALIGYDDYID